MGLRIVSEVSARTLERNINNGGPAANQLQDTYLTRLSKLVPCEAITAYPIFLNGARATKEEIFVALTSWVVLAVVLVLRWKATLPRESGGKAQWPTVIISAVAFVLWVFVMGGNFGFTANVPEVFKTHHQFISGLLLFAWSTIAPAVYTGDPE